MAVAPKTSNRSLTDLEAEAKSRFLVKSRFLKFCEEDGLSVITGYGVEDLRTAPLKNFKNRDFTRNLLFASASRSWLTGSM